MLEKVLYIGIIALPLVMFLAMFGKETVDWIIAVAPDIFNQASTFVGGN